MFVGYARVSTQEQDPALQYDALTKSGCEKIYAEKISSAQRERPQLIAALEFMREGDTLVVYKLDRLARSIRELIDTVEMLESRSIGFRSLTEAIDTTSPGGKLIFHIFAALAEFERGIIRERTNAGLAAARARGKIGGRPPALTPSDRAAAKALLRDPDISVEEVARRLGVSRSVLYREFPGGRSALKDEALLDNL
jgi:DNA invertase Pin-like site-specific DNA recombinase